MRNPDLVEALRLIQEVFRSKTFTIPERLEEEDYRQVFKLAAIVKTGILEGRWEGAQTVFLAEFLRTCPADGVLSEAIMLKIEDWEDELWGTPLHLGPAETVFPSLRILGNVRALIRRAEHTPDGELIEVDCAPVHAGDIVRVTFDRIMTSP